VWYTLCVCGATRDKLLASFSRVSKWEEVFWANIDLPHNWFIILEISDAAVFCLLT